MKNLKISNNKKYLSLGIILILILAISIAIIFSFQQSYALDGFGQLNLSCDKQIALGGENIKCTLSATVAPSSKVSSLSSKIKLSDNLEFVDFTTDSSWIGEGSGGQIDLYTDTNKSATFPIGTFNIKVKEGVINTKEEIGITNTTFFDDTFKDQVIEDTSVEVKTPQYSSDTYQIKDDYILVNTKDIKQILSSIKTEGCTAVVNNNNQNTTTGEITNGAKLRIVNDQNTLKELSIIYINSKKYDMTKDYILSSSENTEDILANIEVIGAEKTIKNNQFVLSYNTKDILTYPLINLTSNSDIIDIDKKNLIITGEINDEIVNNIKTSDNVSLTREENILKLIYQDKEIIQFNIINLTSEIYKINLKENYLYIENNEINTSILSNLKSNATLAINNNKLTISKNNEVLTSLDIVNITSDKYSINTSEKYIYTKTTNSIKDLANNIKVTNGSISLSNNQLNINYKDNKIDTYTIYYLSSNNYKITDKNIYIKEEVDYSVFTSNISFNGLTYQIENKTSETITSGNIKDSYIIKIYKEKTLLDQLEIKIEYLEIKNLSIQEENNIIYDLKQNTTYTNILENIDTSGEVEFYDEENKKLDLNEKVKSYSTLKITLSSGTKTYQLSVLGDATGTGNTNAGDIAKIYQAVKGKITLDDVAILAGDVTKDGKIGVNDVAKAYSYLKGKLSSLD